MIFAVLGLTAARCATFALFRVFLRCCSASCRCSSVVRCAERRTPAVIVGRHGDVGLQHALDAVRSALFGHRIDVDGEALEADVAPPARAHSCLGGIARESSQTPMIWLISNERLAERERREPR